MENTNTPRKKHLRLVQLLFPADKAKKTHHAMHSLSDQAAQQQTGSNQSKLLFVFKAELCTIVFKTNFKKPPKRIMGS